MAEVGHQRVQHDPEYKENHVGIAPADVVRSASPEKSTDHIEQTDETDEARGRSRRDFAVEHFLNHRRCLTQHADTRRHVHAKHDPQQPKLRRAPRDIHRHIGLRHQRSRMRRRNPAGRFPILRRHPHGARADHHEHEIDDAHGDEGFHHTVRDRGRKVLHQDDGKGSRDERTAAESHDSHAGRHARTVRKPLDERRHRRYIADAQPATAQYPIP